MNRFNLRSLGTLALVALTAALSACSSTTDPAEAYPGQSPQKIYAEGKLNLENYDYTEATKHFEALDVQYPFGPQTENAQLYLVYTYYKKEEYALSIAAAERYVRLHPTSPHADYAMYVRGLADFYQNIGVIERIFKIDLSNRDLGQIQKAYADFNDLVNQYPQSRFAPSAHQYMVYLRNVLAEHELHVAQYYYDRKAFMAAVNRASDLVAHYQGAPAVMPGLQIMANSYRELGLTKLEQDTLAVIQANS